jgi:predicted transcriptional regulator of viral defense system
MPASLAPRLFDLASDQAGVFTLAQAVEAGIPKASLTRAAKRGDVARLFRGVYALRDFPVTPDAELWAAVLYPTVDRGGADPGTLSHDNALVHYLPDTDLAPSTIHVTAAFSTPPRREVPTTLTIHRGEVADHERTYTEAGVPVTTIFRTIVDCLRARRHAIEVTALLDRAVRAGDLTADEVRCIERIASDANIEITA